MRAVFPIKNSERLDLFFSLFLFPSVYFDVGRNEHTVRRLSSLCFSYIGRAL